MESGDANAQTIPQETVVVTADKVHTVGTAEPGPGHNVVEQPLSSADRLTPVRTAKNKHIPSHTGKRYGYAMAQIMGSMHGKLASELAQNMAKELRSVREHIRPEVVKMVIVQLSMKAATVKFREARMTKASCVEIKQIHMRNMFVPKHWQDLTHKQKEQIIESFIFV